MITKPFWLSKTLVIAVVSFLVSLIAEVTPLLEPVLGKGSKFGYYTALIGLILLAIKRALVPSPTVLTLRDRRSAWQRRR